jgi:hypothetical protein
MGITISHKLGQQKNCVKSTLDYAENIAKGYKTEQADKLKIAFDIDRKSDTELHINIRGCETLAFNFRSVKAIKEEKEKDGYSYEYNVLTEKNRLDEGYEIAKYPQNEKYYSADFCKTQYGDKIVCHLWVAEIIRAVASRCFYAEILDEGDYYNTCTLGDAGEAIKENKAVIDGLISQLKGLGYK